MAVSPLNIKITGINESLQKLKKNYYLATEEVDREMAASMEQMATTAKSIFPSGNPQIKGQTQKYADIRRTIRSKKNAPFNYSIIAGKPKDPMAAYIEFGTGKYFPQYPGKEKEWQDLAREYYVNGEGMMRPSPYLYPSVKSGIISMISNIKQIFKRNERL